MTPTVPNAELLALIEKVRDLKITPEEREAQRQSWVRGEMGMGSDADEARWKQEHGF